MFTGLIQAVGKINLHGNGVLVETPSSFSPLDLGESISVNGVCLTVSGLRNKAFLADISEETLQKTALAAKAKQQGIVNLERALRLSDRLGGHLVSGHVDGLGRVINVTPLSNSWNLKIALEENIFSKYICNKASIAIDGVSLTVAAIKDEGEIFSIAVIPHTWTNTSLQYLREGEIVNLETDLMAKYAESLLKEKIDHVNSKNNKTIYSPDFSEEWLRRNGY